MPTPRKPTPKIAIIGAGFAGLRCADTLLQHGFHTTIFEARPRLGGRVAQSSRETLEGRTVDLGPNWIHGQGGVGDPMLGLARDTGTEVHSWDEGGEAVFDADGRLLAEGEAEELGELVWGVGGLIEAAFAFSEGARGKAEGEGGIAVERSLYDFFREKVESLFAELPIDLAKRRRERLLQFMRIWGAYVGCDVKRQSLRFFWLEKTIEGENAFVAATYAKILEAVARSAREKADVRLRAKVVRIQTGISGGEEGKVRVWTAEGKSEEFDEVVVTVPLGYLKRHVEAMFDPPLSPRLTAAIDNLGYGNLDKVYITFPSAFWDLPPGGSPTSSSRPLDSEGKTTAPPYPSPNGPSTRPFPSFATWLPPTYAPSSNPCRWDQQAVNLASLPPSTAHPTLLFYIYGDCATHIASLLPYPHDPSKPLDPSTQAELLSFFQPYIALLPNYSPTSPSCHPTAVLATGWSNDEFAGYGSYSNFQIGLEAGDEDILALRDGCPERGVWFAGEHTAPFESLGTATGAYRAGEGVGRRMVSKWLADETEH